MSKTPGETGEDNLTHFGYQKVSRGSKASRVRGVFDSVADKYDVMNDLMSLGIHRAWKKYAIDLCNVQPGHYVLDVAGGTGDLAMRLVERVGEKGHVILSDINEAMLEKGRRRMIDNGIVNHISYVLADAENLPFAENTFDRVTMGFGLRNVTDKQAALASIYRVLKPAAQLLVLEFSKPVIPALNTVYDWYSFNVLPKLGEWVVDDADSYRYLAESIRMHPDQETLLDMMNQVGYEKTCYHNLSGGIVALHRGYKL